MSNNRLRCRSQFDDDIERLGTRAATRVGQDSSFEHFCSPTGHGSLAYVDLGWAWVGAGDPAVARTEGPQLIDDFMRAAHRRRRIAVLFDLNQDLYDKTTKSSLCLGREAIWHRPPDEKAFRLNRRLKDQARRAMNSGVRIESIDIALVRSDWVRQRLLRQLHHRWISRHAMPGLGFIVAPSPFATNRGAILKVAIGADDTLWAYGLALETSNKEELYLKDLIRDPSAPNGTSELLIAEMFAHASTHGAKRVTLGIVPLSGPPSAARNALRRFLLPFYSFEGLEAFRLKLAPHEWRETRLVFVKGHSRIIAVAALLMAFCNNKPLQFAAFFVRKGSPAFIGLTAAALIPWTCFLALSSNSHFGSTGVQNFWVLYDLGLLCGFLRLLARPSHRSAFAMGCAVSADAFASMVQIFFLTVPRGIVPYMVNLVAMAGPILSAISLWGAYRRLKQEQHRLFWPSLLKKLGN